MSREIKFRAWDKETKQYFKVLAIDFKSKIVSCRHFKWKYDLFNQINLIDLDLEQFTGLKDANGKEIYEGDIVHGYDQEPDRDDGYVGSSVVDVVNFGYGAFWIGDIRYKIMVMTPPIIEVIGNIHEDKELLEVDK